MKGSEFLLLVAVILFLVLVVVVLPAAELGTQITTDLLPALGG